MDEETTTGAETAADTAPAGDAAPEAVSGPSYSDMKPEKLIALFEATAERLAKIKGKPVTDDTVAEAKAEHAKLSEIAAEMSARKTKRDELTSELAQLVDVELPTLEDEPPTVGDGIDEAAPPADGGPAPTEKEGELIAASAGAPSAAQVAAAREPQTAAVKIPATPNRRAQALVASAGASQFAPMGQQISYADLGKAINANLRVGRGVKGFERHEAILASLPGYDDSMGELLGDSPERNTILMREAIEAFQVRQAGGTPDPKLAAICEPLDILREIPSAGRSKATPFRDSLPFRGAGRLGFQYFRAALLADITSGLDVWSDVDIAAVDPDDEATWKPVFDVTCGTALSTRAQELTWGLRFDEATDLSSPERVQDILDALMTAEARRSEGYLLRRFDQMAYGYAAATANLGGVPDIAEYIGRLWEKATYVERTELGGATLAIPPGLMTALRIDKVSRGFDARPEADVLAELQAALPDRMRVVQLRDISDNGDIDPDGNDGAGAATSIANEAVAGGGDIAYGTIGAAATAISHDGCDTFRLRLYWPENFLAYSTGRSDTGVLRSPELIRMNRSIMFGREWLGIARPGPHPGYYLTLNVMRQGVRMGMVTADAVDCSS